MLKLFEKTFKSEVIIAPAVTINGDEFKTYDTDEEAIIENENRSDKKEMTVELEEVKERKDNNF